MTIAVWIPEPADHAVHFLVKRTLAGGQTTALRRREQRTISLRVVLQAHIDSEMGPLRVPMPVLDDYEPFDASRHGALPEKEPNALNPFRNKPLPYWIVTEVPV